MESIRAYILSVTAAALLCGILTKLCGSEGITGKLVQTVAGLVMVLVVINPMLNLVALDFTTWFDSISEYADQAVSEGESRTNNALAARIKLEAESYILDKAADYQAMLEVEILLSNDTLPLPAGAILKGDISPYAKTQISRILEADLGIKTEDQVWK